MTKNEKRDFASLRGYEIKFDGNNHKAYLFRFPAFRMNIHKLINDKP